MKRVGAGWLPALLGLAFWASCNIVREVRRECPCSLAVELRALPAAPVQLYLNGTAAAVARRDTTLRVQVEKGPVAFVAAVTGAAALEDGSVRIPLGSDAPPLYAAALVADCSADTARVRMFLRRHYCTLTLAVSAPPGWGTPYRVEVRGSVDGWSLRGSAPTHGPFHCTLSSYPAPTGSSCRLPRQLPGDPLWLDIAVPDGEGEVLRSFPLGSLLLEAGYNWSAPDLTDISLQLDLSVTEIRFSLPGWSAVIPLEIEV